VRVQLRRSCRLEIGAVVCAPPERREQGNINVDKQFSRILGLGGIGLAVILAGGCKAPAPDESAAPVMPPARKPNATAGGPMSPAGAPGKAPGGVAKGKEAGAPARPGAKGTDGKSPAGGAPKMAKGNTDPFAPGGARPAAPTAIGAAPGTPASAADTSAMVAYSGHRRDPFLIDWKKKPIPPDVFDQAMLEPIRLASAEIETPHPQPYEVREQPEMRVSGIMTGDGVFAILETGGGKVDVVKPGSSVEIEVGGQTKRTYNVVSITKDKVKLRSQVGNVIYTQEVPLSDVAVGSAPRGGFPSGPGGVGGGPSSGGFGAGGAMGLPGSGGGGFGPGNSAAGSGGRGRGR